MARARTARKPTKTPAGKKRGAKGKDWREALPIIAEAIAGAETNKGAYLRAGIGHTLFYEWMGVPEFAEAITRARAARRKVLLERIDAASQNPKNWQAAKYLLAVNHPEEFSERIVAEHSGPGGGPIETGNVLDLELAKAIRGNPGSLHDLQTMVVTALAKKRG